MFLFAFAFPRCSEFTTSTFHVDSSRHACISDSSHFSDHCFLLRLQFCKCQSITMTDCLFISKSGQMATCFSFHHHFRLVLSLSGNLRVNYSGHSFRIRVATSASHNGIPEHFMRPMGCWSSKTFHHYIHSDLKDLRSAQYHLK